MEKLHVILIGLITIELISIFSIPTAKISAVLAQHTEKQITKPSLKVKNFLNLSPTPEDKKQITISTTVRVVNKSDPTPTPATPSVSSIPQSSPTPSLLPGIDITPTLFPLEIGKTGFVKGKVLIGPTCPGPIHETDGDTDSCADKPYSTNVVVKNSDGFNFKTTSDDNGEFKIELKPGTYTVTAGPNADSSGVDRYPSTGSQDITIATGQTTEITFDLDTGIR